MEFVFDNDRPIYIQLIEQLELYIVSGRLKPGERLPSVREYALISKVNPNTMQKALGELEEKGLIFTERTNGKFVTEDVALLKECREKYADKNRIVGKTSRIYCVPRGEQGRYYILYGRSGSAA